MRTYCRKETASRPRDRSRARPASRESRTASRAHPCRSSPRSPVPACLPRPSVLPRRVISMLTAHHTVAFLVLGVTVISALAGGFVYFRGGSAGGILSHILTLSQTLLVPQGGVGPPVLPP